MAGSSAPLRAAVSPKYCLFAHSVIFAWYVFVLDANNAIAKSGLHAGARAYGGRWKYLTFINLVLQTVFFGLCVLNDLIRTAFPGKSSISAFLVSAQDFLFTVVAFPIGTFVFTSFWSIYSYNRELVFPKVLDGIIPTWLNHAMHTVILPLLLVQMCLQHHKHPSRSTGILALALFASLYLTWVLWVHHVSGIWVYPILAHLGPAGLMVFLGVSCLSLAPLYLLGEKLSRVVWSSTVCSLKANQKKKRKK